MSYNFIPKYSKKEIADFEKFSEINVLRTLIAFWNTDGGIIRICNIGNVLDEYYFYSVLQNNKEKLPSSLFSYGIGLNINVLSNSLLFRSSTIDGIQYFIIEVRSTQIKDHYYYLSENDSKNYYFRVNGKNVKTDEKNASYWEKIALYNSPIYNDYQPIDDALNDILGKLSEEIVVRSIGEMTRNTYVYKYMDLESALLSLESGTLRFVEPTNWDDQYEGRFYNAEYYDTTGNLLDPNLTPFLYATCLSTKPENEAAWILYSHNKKGLAARCVEFKLNIKVLLDQITQQVIESFSAGNRMSLYFGLVNYLTKFTIDNLHSKYLPNSTIRNKNYLKYFQNFSLKCYLNLLLLKRVAFEHEKEFRIFIIPDDKLIKTRKIGAGEYCQNGKTGKEIYPQTTFIKLDWSSLIHGVRYDMNCTKYEYSMLEKALYKINPNISIEKYDPYEDKSTRKSPLKISTY